MPSEIIKKHSNKNEYLLASSNVWVRNMYKEHVFPVDINKLSTMEDYSLYLENESENKKYKIPSISNIPIHENIIIVSDGLDFKEKHKILAQTSPKDVTIIAVNGALNNWDLIGSLTSNDQLHRRIDYYVVNNPYKECVEFLPSNHRYYPQCIASSRTNEKFMYKYTGNKLIYQPVEDKMYSSVFKNSIKIDDYRNPICAAINLACKFKVKNLLLFCCDDTLKEYRPAANPTHDGYWRYPQQEISENIIDANLYWLRKENVKTQYHSIGAKYLNAEYTALERIPEFYV